MVKIAICQMGALDAKETNLNKICQMAEQAAKQVSSLDVIVFPEYAYFEPDQLSETQQPESIPGPFTERMCALAKKLKVNLIPGSFMSKAPNGKFYNTCLFIDREGMIRARYDKIHLMVALGADESAAVEYGTKPCVIDADFGRIGIMVCYDMRFVELSRGMVQDGADILFVPAEFPAGAALPPRTDHWDGLVRATALMNLTYTVAANQYGKVALSLPFGRSQVVDPWGTVIAQCPNCESIIYADIDLDRQKAIRKSVASWENRRPDVYTLDK